MKAPVQRIRRDLERRLQELNFKQDAALRDQRISEIRDLYSVWELLEIRRAHFQREVGIAHQRYNTSQSYNLPSLPDDEDRLDGITAVDVTTWLSEAFAVTSEHRSSGNRQVIAGFVPEVSPAEIAQWLSIRDEPSDILLKRIYDRIQQSYSSDRVGLLTRNPQNRTTNIEQVAKLPSPSGPSTETIEVFISHTHADADPARLLAELLQVACGFRNEEIRCTSAEGYRIPVGEDFEKRLRREAVGSRVLIGLVSSASLRSAWVFFELGARWGAGGPIVPLLLGDVSAADLPGPLKELVAGQVASEHDLYQVVEQVANLTRRHLAKASNYAYQISRLVATTRA